MNEAIFVRANKRNRDTTVEGDLSTGAGELSIYLYYVLNKR